MAGATGLPPHLPYKLAKERQAIASKRALRDPQLQRILRRLRLTEDLNLAIQARLFGYTMEEALGDDAGLASYTRAELVNFHWQRYTPANAGLAIVGSVTRDQVAELAESYFGDLPTRPAPPGPPTNYPKGPHDVAVHGPVERHQITLALGARTVGCAHADRWPLEVLQELLGQRLLAELRFRRGLTYTPWAYNVFHRDSGYFGAQITVADRHEDWARDTLLGEIDELTQAAPKRREARPPSGIFDSAARVVWANWAAADENNYERAATLADPILDWLADQPPPDTPHLRPPQVGAGVEAALTAVTPADIHRVARAYFVPERRFVGRTPRSSPWTTWRRA